VRRLHAGSRLHGTDSQLRVHYIFAGNEERNVAIEEHALALALEVLAEEFDAGSQVEPVQVLDHDGSLILEVEAPFLEEQRVQFGQVLVHVVHSETSSDWCVGTILPYHRLDGEASCRKVDGSAAIEVFYKFVVNHVLEIGELAFRKVVHQLYKLSSILFDHHSRLLSRTASKNFSVVIVIVACSGGVGNQGSEHRDRSFSAGAGSARPIRRFIIRGEVAKVRVAASVMKSLRRKRWHLNGCHERSGVQSKVASRRYNSSRSSRSSRSRHR